MLKHVTNARAVKVSAHPSRAERETAAQGKSHQYGFDKDIKDGIKSEVDLKWTGNQIRGIPRKGTVYKTVAHHKRAISHLIDRFLWAPKIIDGVWPFDEPGID